MQKVYVHIGAHKSASTTLQANLGLNEGLLSNKGYLYISPTKIAQSSLGAHFRKISRNRINEFNGFDESLAQAKLSLKQFMMLSANQKLNPIFSWEGILGHSALDFYHGIYTTIDLIAKSLAEIFSEYDAHFLLIIRRNDDFIESCYLQQIKECRTLAFHDFVENINPEKIFWGPVLHSLSAYLGGDRLAVVPFELIKHVGASGFVKYCLEKMLGIKLDLSDFDWHDQANPSLSIIGVDVLLNILPHLDNAMAKKILVRYCFENLSSAKYGKPVLFDSLTRNMMVSFCREDNMELFKSYIESDLINYKDLVDYYIGNVALAGASKPTPKM